MNTVMKTSDRGVGLVITMMVLFVLVGLTGMLISLSTTQTAVVVNYRRSLELLYAAEAALELVVHDLGRVGSWELASRGHLPSGVWLTDARVPMSDGGALDLDQVTVEVPLRDRCSFGRFHG